jgi:hydrogenase maturation protein HypF
MVDALGVEAAGAHPLAREVIRDDARRAGILALLERDLRSPPSTGLGRLFDAAASLLGVCPENRYEAESGQRLEALARRSGARPGGAGVIPEVAPTRRLEDGNHEAGTGNSSPFELDHRPLLISLLQRVQKGYLTSDLAWFFHDAVADALARGALRATREAGLGIVGLSGGVFCNELLSGQVQRKLEAHGLQVLRHQQVPPNDGGIALGQAAVASARGRLTTG